jgi:hypothetical protein
MKMHSLSGLVALSVIAVTLPSCNIGPELGGPLAIRGTRPLFLPLSKRLHDKLPHPEPGNDRAFQNEPTLLHLAANEFFFEQSAGKPFTFTSQLVHRDGKPWVIQPMSMLTTGATVPRFFWSVKGFGAMDFAKSAVIHDWLFEAHHRWCIAYYTSKSNDPQSRRESHRLLRELKDYADPALQKDLLEALKEYRVPHLTRSEQDRLAKDIKDGDTLNIVQAADIMAECIDWEMRQCGAFVKALEEFLKKGERPDGKALTDGEKTGIQAIVSDLKHITHSPITLAQWHWSIRSFLAKKYWNAERGGTKGAHASSDLTISALKDSDLLALARDSGYLSADAIARLSPAPRADKTVPVSKRLAAYESLSQEAERVKQDEGKIKTRPIDLEGGKTMSVRVKVIY